MKKSIKVLSTILTLIFLAAAYSVIDYGYSIYDQFTNPQQNIATSKNISDDGFSIYDSREDAIDALNKLEIAEPEDVDYSSDIRSDEYGGWKNADGTNTRVAVLVDQAVDSKVEDGRVVSGMWQLPYNGQEVTYNDKKDISDNLQIDHVIPVGYAHRHGAAHWDNDKKQEFYNDFGVNDGHAVGTNNIVDYPKVGNLIVSDRTSNISKSDSGPSEWLPENPKYVREYCEKWVQVASNYGISITQDDYNTILDVFNS